MIETNIDIHGLAELEKSMAEFDEKLRKKALNSASRAGIKTIEALVKQQAPISEQAFYRRYPSHKQSGKNGKRSKRGQGNYRLYQAGALKRSIKIRMLKKGERNQIRAESAYAIYIGKDEKQNYHPYYWGWYMDKNMYLMPKVPKKSV